MPPGETPQGVESMDRRRFNALLGGSLAFVASLPFGCDDGPTGPNDSDASQSARDQKVEKVKPAPTLDTNTIKIDTKGYPLSAGGIEYPFTFEAKNATDWSVRLEMVTPNPDGGTIKFEPGSITPVSGGVANNTVDQPVTYKSGNAGGTDFKIFITVKGPGGDLTVSKPFHLN